MKIKPFLLPVILLLILAASEKAASQKVLDKYIHTGLDSNLALKQKSFDLAKGRLDLQRAKALFYPQAGINAQYTVATGGRTIDFPIGDLLNPVYSTLNQLTSSTKFPQLANQTIQFLPNDFNDTKIEVTVPVYNPSLKYNQQIKQEMLHGYEAEIQLYKRELVKNIKQAYYQYLQCVKAVEIYTNALGTVQESLRFNEKLVSNNTATKEVVLKAKAQVSQVQTHLTEAKQNQLNAAAYFNFLLNLPLDTPIEKDIEILQQIQESQLVQTTLPSNREELTKLKSAQTVLEKNLRLNQSYKLPVLSAFYNAGFQGFGYKFNDKQFYQLAGVQLNWNLFKGNDNKLKAAQTQLDIDAIKNQYSTAEKQIQLQVTTTYNSYKASLETLNSAADETISTKEVYRLTDLRYKQGQALQIELIDARTQMTNAALQYSLAQLAVLNQAAELERAAATYALP
ncbi:TolC family protein [Limnovirga soli]|uniref:TolC family protein n=1 Tax=Limnovirga soli TaxID=2656915 RepID=A0A8J8JU81_9BACT|nr:TolC family protein [Limnovirga soli]NNV56030.1 TolC family protein [Limnovirga soli]